MMSTYNGERYLREQLESILAQSEPCDIYVRDDGSSDSTLDILKEYQDKYESVTYEVGKNIGYNRSFFKMINEISGYQYYAMSDQDDIWLKDKIQTALAEIDKLGDEPVLFGCQSQLFSEDEENMGTTKANVRGYNLYSAMIENFFAGHNEVMNQKMLDLQKGNYDISQIYGHDSWIMATAVLRGKTVFLNQVFTLYRQHSGNALGYRESRISWLMQRLKRIFKSGDSKKYGRQIAYFNEYYHNLLNDEQKKELDAFVKSQGHFLTRLGYICKTKCYRQSGFETLAFKMLYLLGGYHG